MPSSTFHGKHHQARQLPSKMLMAEGKMAILTPECLALPGRNQLIKQGSCFWRQSDNCELPVSKQRMREPVGRWPPSPEETRPVA